MSLLIKNISSLSVEFQGVSLAPNGEETITESNKQAIATSYVVRASVWENVLVLWDGGQWISNALAIQLLDRLVSGGVLP